MSNGLLAKVQNWVGKHILYGRFPYAYARFYYWKSKGRTLSYSHPEDFNQKMFWLARYWQDPRIVQCADKLAVRDYLRGIGLEGILTKVYGVYKSADEIDFDAIPKKFVLKTNHCCGGANMVICHDKSLLDYDAARKVINESLSRVYGLPTCEYHYQYIKPRAYCEGYIGDENNERLEIQFFCFNGTPRHILVRNDLGDAAKKSFAISYDMNWNRVKERKREDMSVGIPRPAKLDEMIAIAKKMAKPFPQVRIDLYYVGETIYFGEMTFSTSGNILWNYTDEVLKRWGDELVLPKKLKSKWSTFYKSQLSKGKNGNDALSTDY